MFAIDSPFQSGLIFVGKAGAYLSAKPASLLLDSKKYCSRSFLDGGMNYKTFNGGIFAMS